MLAWLLCPFPPGSPPGVATPHHAIPPPGQCWLPWLGVRLSRGLAVSRLQDAAALLSGPDGSPEGPEGSPECPLGTRPQKPTASAWRPARVCVFPSVRSPGPRTGHSGLQGRLPLLPADTGNLLLFFLSFTLTMCEIPASARPALPPACVWPAEAAGLLLFDLNHLSLPATLSAPCLSLFRKEPPVQDGRVTAQEPSAQAGPQEESSRGRSGRWGLEQPRARSHASGVVGGLANDRHLWRSALWSSKEWLRLPSRVCVLSCFGRVRLFVTP